MATLGCQGDLSSLGTTCARIGKGGWVRAFRVWNLILRGCSHSQRPTCMTPNQGPVMCPHCALYHPQGGAWKAHPEAWRCENAFNRRYPLIIQSTQDRTEHTASIGGLDVKKFDAEPWLQGSASLALQEML